MGDYWRTSGRSRLKARAKSSMATRAEKRAAVVRADFLYEAAPAPSSRNRNLKKRSRKLSDVCPHGNGEMNPLALRGIVSSGRNLKTSSPGPENQEPRFEQGRRILRNRTRNISQQEFSRSNPFPASVQNSDTAILPLFQPEKNNASIPPIQPGARRDRPFGAGGDFGNRLFPTRTIDGNEETQDAYPQLPWNCNGIISRKSHFCQHSADRPKIETTRFVERNDFETNWGGGQPFFPARRGGVFGAQGSPEGQALFPPRPLGIFDMQQDPQMRYLPGKHRDRLVRPSRLHSTHVSLSPTSGSGIFPLREHPDHIRLPAPGHSFSMSGPGIFPPQDQSSEYSRFPAPGRSSSMSELGLFTPQDQSSEHRRFPAPAPSSSIPGPAIFTPRERSPEHNGFPAPGQSSPLSGQGIFSPREQFWGQNRSPAIIHPAFGGERGLFEPRYSCEGRITGKASLDPRLGTQNLPFSKLSNPSGQDMPAMINAKMPFAANVSPNPLSAKRSSSHLQIFTNELDSLPAALQSSQRMTKPRGLFHRRDGMSRFEDGSAVKDLPAYSVDHIFASQRKESRNEFDEIGDEHFANLADRLLAPREHPSKSLLISDRHANLCLAQTEHVGIPIFPSEPDIQDHAVFNHSPAHVQTPNTSLIQNMDSDGCFEHEHIGISIFPLRPDIQEHESAKLPSTHGHPPKTLLIPNMPLGGCLEQAKQIGDPIFPSRPDHQQGGVTKLHHKQQKATQDQSCPLVHPAQSSNTPELQFQTYRAPLSRKQVAQESSAVSSIELTESESQPSEATWTRKKSKNVVDEAILSAENSERNPAIDKTHLGIDSKSRHGRVDSTRNPEEKQSFSKGSASPAATSHSNLEWNSEYSPKARRGRRQPLRERKNVASEIGKSSSASEVSETETIRSARERTIESDLVDSQSQNVHYDKEGVRESRSLKHDENRKCKVGDEVEEKSLPVQESSDNRYKWWNDPDFDSDDEDLTYDLLKKKTLWE